MVTCHCIFAKATGSISSPQFPDSRNNAKHSLQDSETQANIHGDSTALPGDVELEENTTLEDCELGSLLAISHRYEGANLVELHDQAGTPPLQVVGSRRGGQVDWIDSSNAATRHGSRLG